MCVIPCARGLLQRGERARNPSEAGMGVLQSFAGGIPRVVTGEVSMTAAVACRENRARGLRIPRLRPPPPPPRAGVVGGAGEPERQLLDRCRIDEQLQVAVHLVGDEERHLPLAGRVRVNEHFVPGVEALEAERALAQSVSVLVRLDVVHDRLHWGDSVEKDTDTSVLVVNLTYSTDRYS